MMLDYLSGILVRDLRSLRTEIEAYTDDRDLWRVVPGITNSAGTLALHLTGGLQYLIGGVLGGTGYVRDRDAEFARRDVSRKELLQLIDTTAGVVERTLAKLTERDATRLYPESVAGVDVSTGDFLLHLAVHLTYHVGQIDYHRRILTGEARPVRTMVITELKSAKPAKQTS
jgi:uncharacterized damage-inducible protein DinB